MEETLHCHLNNVQDSYWAITMTIHSHALTEFRAAGWIDETDRYVDEMQQAICEHVLKLLDVFAAEGHSGSSAPYAVDLFKKLAMFEPLVPLTGEDWEWNEISAGMMGRPGVYQNKRCSHVFKENGEAYDSQGIVFWDWYTDEETGEKYKSYFTSIDSRVKIEFPYTPKVEYAERVSN